MKKFKHPLSLPVLTLCLGLSALSINNHANAAESNGSIKSSLQQEAVSLSNLAADQTIISAVQTANQNQDQDKNTNTNTNTKNKLNKLNKSDSDKVKNNLSSNPLSQKLLDSQKTWLKKRELECKLQGNNAEYGEEQITTLNCETEMTNSRVDQLKQAIYQLDANY